MENVENEITVAMIRDAMRDGNPELAADYVVLLAKDRDNWKEQALETVLFIENIKTVSERTAAHALVVEEERDELQGLLRSAEAYIEQDLKIQADALKKVNAEQLARIEELSDQLDEAEANYSRVARSYVALEIENGKLREAVTEAPWRPGLMGDPQ